jgi:tungstate transport system substrate-binding protein
VRFVRFKRFRLLGLINTARIATLLIANIVILGTAQAQSFTLASTTSTEQSGLFAHLLPLFKQASGIDVKVVAVGSGQALDMARRGDADALLVHDTAAEEKFVADGFSTRRYSVMYNDFIVVGPQTDPAAVKGNDIAFAMKKIIASNAAFISRGDKSGTHTAELRFWSLLTEGPGTTAARGAGYKECGCGMGAALNIASQVNAYALTDRGTWVAFKNRGNLAVLVQADSRLLNPYGALVVSPAKHPHVKVADAQRFVDWLVSTAGQGAIARYTVGGEQLFFPNAQK